MISPAIKKLPQPSTHVQSFPRVWDGGGCGEHRPGKTCKLCQIMPERCARVATLQAGMLALGGKLLMKYTGTECSLCLPVQKPESEHGKKGRSRARTKIKTENTGLQQKCLPLAGWAVLQWSIVVPWTLHKKTGPPPGDNGAAREEVPQLSAPLPSPTHSTSKVLIA